MQLNDHKRQIHMWHKLAAIMLTILTVLSVLMPVSVFADPDEPYRPVEHLIIVVDSSNVASALNTALSSASDNGRTESGEHIIVSVSGPGDIAGSTYSALTSHVPGWKAKKENCAVIYWLGWMHVSDVQTFTYEYLEKEELDDFQQQWAVRCDSCSYEAIYPGADEPDLSDERATHDALFEEGEDVSGHTLTCTQEDSDEHQYTYTVQHATCHKKLATLYQEALNENTGLKDYLKDNQIKSYWATLPPTIDSYDDQYNNDDYLDEDYYKYTDAYDTVNGVIQYQDPPTNSKRKKLTRDKPIAELWGYWSNKWNESIAGQKLDIGDALITDGINVSGSVMWVGDNYWGDQSHPADSQTSSGTWVGPDDDEETIESAGGDLEYDEKEAIRTSSGGIAFNMYATNTWQDLIHILINTVQVMNPKPASGDAIEQGLYPVSAALTAYVNKVIGFNTDEDHADHLIADTNGVGNAGAIIGYGDPAFDFVDSVAVTTSGQSTAIAYSSLKNSDNNQLKDALGYAQYGHLLSDMGLDDVGMKKSRSIARWLQGIPILVVYTLSIACGKIFGFLMKLLVILNPFRFFLAYNPTSGWTGMLAGAVSDADSTVTGSLGQTVINGTAMSSLVKKISLWYEALLETSYELIIPVGLAITVFLFFLYSRLFKPRGEGEQKQKTIIWKWVARVAFIVMGVPLLGMIYSSVLSSLVIDYDDSNNVGAQIVASTYVDFEAWANGYRLQPVNGGVFESDTSDLLAGIATENTTSSLRKTTLAINKATGVVDNSVGLISSGDAFDWAQAAINSNTTPSQKAVSQCYTLLSRYLAEDFYYPSDWEADVSTSLQRQVKSVTTNSATILGRREGGDEEDFDAEVYQGEHTVYNMYDSTNERQDWLDRTLEENNDIFNWSKGIWKADPDVSGSSMSFNVFNNGTLSLSQSGNKLTFSKGGSSAITTREDGVLVNKRGGLSTLSMYNYLSSNFEDESVVVYSNAQSVNLQTKYAHYSVNSIGSGVLGIMYWLNSFVIMAVICIIGIFYFMTTLVNVLKKGFTVLASIPGAMLGVLKSIAVTVSTVITMILELITVSFMYILISDLLGLVVNVVEGLMTEAPSGGQSLITIIVNTINVSDIAQSAVGSGIGLNTNLLFTSIGLVVIAGVLMRYRRAHERVSCFIIDKVYDIILTTEVKNKLAEKEHVFVKRPVYVPVRGFLADVVAICRNTYV